MKNSFIKGLFMALVGFVATMLTGLETFNLAYVLITTVGFTVVYIGKNYAFPSMSAVGVDLRDMLSGLILAVGMALSSIAAQVLTTGFEWKTLWISVAGAVIGYFAKTIPTNSKEK